MCCVFLQYGDNALHNAAVKGHSDVANLLLQKQPDLIMQTNKVSEQLLYISMLIQCLVEGTQSHNRLWRYINGLAIVFL